MRVEGPVFVNIVVVMASMASEGVLTGQGEVAMRDPAIDDPSASVSVDDGIAGNLVDWMTIVGVVLDWDSTHAGGNCWQIKSETIF